MKIFLNFFAFQFVLFAITNCQTVGYWQQQVDFKINVSLNDELHTLSGFEKIDYYNNSPDTLKFIWIHLWPNAYKNDRTAFSDQMLKNGSTEFYFSNNENRGYINRLDFTVNNSKAKIEDHPQHQDIIKLLLTVPLLPGEKCIIQTPFHIKLPYNFSRSGHIGQSYQITQWYPKPAVYDKNGWHPMPYLDQGEFYSEFGNYQVQITIPQNYVVAATGSLQDEEEKEWIKKRKSFKSEIKNPKENIPSSSQTKTLHYLQNNVHDFAWFADKRFKTKIDTLHLSSGKIIDVEAFYFEKNEILWKNSIQHIKEAIFTKSNWIGEYPYNVVSVVDNAADIPGGMEYPTIALLNSGGSEAGLQSVINHEVGHNWFYGILANNERVYPWMDEGMNSYYDKRFEAQYFSTKDGSKFLQKETFVQKRMPYYPEKMFLQNLIKTKKDQPINNISEIFSWLNYNLFAYEKAAEWMQYLENQLSKTVLDSCMKVYYSTWSFKHPYPDDFKKILEEVSGKNLDSTFSLLNTTGALPATTIKKTIKIFPFFNFKDTDKHNYIFVAPSIGYNNYNKLMLGIVVHNYTLPSTNLQFAITPLFSTNSKKLNGIGEVNYNWYLNNTFSRIVLGINAAKFSTNYSLDTNLNKIFSGFSKIVPTIKLYLNQKNKSSTTKWFDLRLYNLVENSLNNYEYINGSDSSIRYPTAINQSKRFISQLSFNTENTRVLYPYSYQLQLQSSKDFYRINITGNSFFNYAKGGGLQARIFFAKFGYIGGQNFTSYPYLPKLLAGNGEQDYTYNNYFLGRTASTSLGQIPISNGGIAAQQIMINNGGGLKLRLDPYSGIQGYSDNWLAAINLSSTIPDKILPAKIPLKVFLDLGTQAEAWKNNSGTPRFVYVGGFQISLLKNIVHIYAPVFYSKIYKQQLVTDKEANKFINKITFSVDIQKLSIKNLIPQLNF